MARQEHELEYCEGWPDESSEPDKGSRSTRVQRPSQRFRVVFPIGDGRVSEHSFELALQTAQRFSATLDLVYLAKPLVVSFGLPQYAKVERIMDFEWRHYESLTSARLESFGRRADEAGVRWQGTFSLAGMRDVLKSYSGAGDTLVVLNGEKEKNKNINGRWSRLLRLFGFSRPVVRAQILFI